MARSCRCRRGARAALRRRTADGPHPDRAARSHLLCRSLPGSDTVVLLPGDDVYTLAGLRGRIVLGTGFFGRLELAEQRVVTAHEWSHLRRRHHLHIHLTDIAVAANPLLAGAGELVRTGIERWADEDAATATGDRRAAARALARVALLRNRLQTAPATAGVRLAAASGQVTARVQALLLPALPARSPRLLLALVLAAGCLGVGVVALLWVHALLEFAQGGRSR